MDTVIVIIIAVAGFAAFDLAALRWGTDSRPTIGDDHRRTA
jgi:hypothetical protein